MHTQSMNYSLHQVSRQHLLTDGLLCQSQPKLTGFESHILIRILGSLQHVLREGTGTRNVQVGFKQEKN